MWHRLTLLFALGLICVVGPPATADDVPPLTPGALLQGLLPTVVNITAYIGQPESSPSSHNAAVGKATAPPRWQTLTGSGFIVDPDGYIATNDHVIDGAYRIVVTFLGGNTAEAKLVGGSRLADIALIRVQTGSPLPAAHWGDSKALQIGDAVFAVGDPLGIGLSVTSGIVSALHRNINDTPYDDFIQTDAAINHGNSGGPLFNMRGEVVGMNTAIISPTTGFSGLGFAIPSSGLHFVVDRLRQYGWIRAGWLGVKVEEVSPEIANALGLKDAGGVIVANVSDGSPASNAHLQIGDVITRFGGVAPANEPEFLRDIVHTDIGTKVDLTVLRNGQTLTVPVVIAEWPRTLWDSLNAPRRTTSVVEPIAPDLGLTMTRLTNDARARYGITTHQTGVLITGVRTNADAAHRGVVAGDVILRVQDTIVTSEQEVKAALDKARAGRRNFAALLILPKTAAIPGPLWMALRIAND